MTEHVVEGENYGISNLESTIVITVQKPTQPYLQQNFHIKVSYVEKTCYPQGGGGDVT
jgi:hypothetical protein